MSTEQVNGDLMATELTLAQRLRPLILPTLVLLVACAAAAMAYARFLESPRKLWHSTIHDRNAHYHLGLRFAHDIRGADVVGFIDDMNSSRVWGPLHGVVQGIVLAIAGDDYRWAVLPCLAAWVLAALFAFLLARRIPERGGEWAGLVAAVLVLGSPAYQAFATDIMIEGPGACLTLAVLYAAVVGIQTRSVVAMRWCGALLTALFTLKYNYWLLVVLAAMAAEATQRFTFYREEALNLWARNDWRRVLHAELRQPLNYLTLVLLLAAAWVIATGGGKYEIVGVKVSLTSPHNLLHFAYIALFLRTIHWWRRGGSSLIVERLAPAPRQLVYWHLLPMSIWFLFPKRLGYFLWYLSSANAGEHPQRDWFGGYTTYFNWFAADYHTSLAIVATVFALLGYAIVTSRRLRPGAAILVWFVLIAVLVTCNHTNRKSRFLHSSMGVVWVLAGAGAAQLLFMSPMRGRRLRPILATATVGGLALAHLPSTIAGGHAPEGGPKIAAVSTLDICDEYLPYLASSERTSVFSNMPLKFMSHWTYLERYGRDRKIETEMKGDDEPDADLRAMAATWLETTASDTVVYIDIAESGPLFQRLPGPDPRPLRELLETQSKFLRVRKWSFPDHGCTVTLWTRQPAVLAAAVGDRRR